MAEDIWSKMLKIAEAEYHPEEISPFITAHHVACAIEAEDGQIFGGFCIESASNVIGLCAERVAALDMYIHTKQTVIKKLILAGLKNPESNDWTPCGACREFFLQLNIKNEEMEIMYDFPNRKTIKLKELIPHWWGIERYKEK